MVTQSLMETPLMEITKNQNMVFEVEAFLEEGFKFRRNVINGKVEMCYKGENKWNVLTTEAFNSLVIKALKDGVGGDVSPLKVIEQFVRSTAIPEFNPIVEYINCLNGMVRIMCHLFSDVFQKWMKRCWDSSQSGFSQQWLIG